MTFSQLTTELGAHVCRECGHLHEVVPSCVTCDRSIELRRFWFDVGHDQGERDTALRFSRERESYLSRISELEAHVGQRVAKAAQAPSYAELQRRRNGGQ